MGYKRVKFEQKGFDEAEYKRYFHQKQAEYIRTKLRSILLYHQGKEFEEIAEILSVHHQSLRKYVNIYIESGFAGLCQEVNRPQNSQLNAEQSAFFKEILLNKRPSEVGLIGNIWTGNLMCQYLKSTYNIVYKSGIYDLLERLNLSHQKAHADYANAKPSEQKAFLEDLKTTLLEADEKTAVVKFDEFSVCEKPSSYYGWATKNTRPKFITDEKNEREQMGC
jgi:transposase